MAQLGNLSTASDQHSIKEAVISFTVSPKINNLSIIENLLNDGSPFYNLFQQFEPINVREIKIDNRLNKTDVEDIVEKGFKLISFEAGKVTNIIQGIPRPQSTLLTFNTVKYDGWNNFLKRSLEWAKEIALAYPVLSVLTMGVMFVDEFYFADESSFNPKDIFNSSSRIIPQNILESDLTDFSLSNHKKNGATDYMENLSIQVFTDVDSQTKVIRITGNIMSFVSPTLLLSVVESSELTNYLDFAHEQNKIMLKNILSKDAIEIIKLC